MCTAQRWSCAEHTRTGAGSSCVFQVVPSGSIPWSWNELLATVRCSRTSNVLNRVRNHCATLHGVFFRSKLNRRLGIKGVRPTLGTYTVTGTSGSPHGPSRFGARPGGQAPSSPNISHIEQQNPVRGQANGISVASQPSKHNVSARESRSCWCRDQSHAFQLGLTLPCICDGRDLSPWH